MPEARSHKKVESKSSVKLVGGFTNGLDILRYLSKANGPVGVSQVARDVSMNPSTCFNLLKTLVHEGLAEFDEQRKTYTLGYGLVELAKQLLQRDQYISLLRPRVEKLVQTYGATGSLWRRLGNDRVILVERVDNDAAVRIHMTVGQRLPMFVAALGRCMAAYSGLTQADLKRHFDRLRWENPPVFADYLADIEQVRAHGYAVDRDNYVKGVTTISAPVVDQSGVAVMAVSLVAFSAQFNASTLKQIGAELSKQSREVTAILVGAKPEIGGRHR